MSLNKIFLQGRLTKDIDVRELPNGGAVASTSIAVDRDFKDKITGEKKTDFVNVVAYRQTAEFFSKFFSKGRMAIVEGRLQIRDYTDKEGNKRTIAEVVADNVYFGESKKDGDNQNNFMQPSYSKLPDADQMQELEDDGTVLPF